MRVPPVLTAVLAIILLAGCGSPPPSTSSTTHRAATHAAHPVTTRHTPSTPKHPPRRTSAKRKLPSVGRTLRVHAPGTMLSVTIQSVLDPLRNTHAAIPPGSRAVGVTAEIVNDGPGDYDSSSTGDFSLVPSSGVAMPVFAPSGQCQTPLRDWDNEISPGETRNGCVVFAVPGSAKVLAIRFSPDAKPVGRVSWAG